MSFVVKIKRGGDTEIELEHDYEGNGVWAKTRIEGVMLHMRFPAWDGKGEVLEVRLLPDASELDPTIMRYIGKQFPVLVEHARASIAGREGDATSAIRALRAAGRTTRGLGEQHYRLVAVQYEALVANGEKAPIKALGEMNHVTISAASRWVKEARRRGYTTEGDKEKGHGT
jgi:hypothetical protein